MIKTDLELLEKNRDDAQSMVLAITAQINLTKGKIVGLGDNGDREGRERMLAGLEKELEGHKKMVREFDKMIEDYKKAHSISPEERKRMLRGFDHENKTRNNTDNLRSE